MAKDINKDPYDEATLVKLDIFEQYLIAWLPVFIHTPHTNKIMICDFFAGSGQDIESVPGSPLRILRVIEKFEEQIFKKNIQINIILNENKRYKFDELQDVVSANFNSRLWKQKVEVLCFKKDFQVLFRELYMQLKQQPNLLFIDQNGIKHVDSEIFQMLIELDRTDMLFFMSSSYLNRFVDTPEFKIHFDDLDSEMIKNARYKDIHRIMLDYYKKKIPGNNETKLYPYTLKKDRGNNIYGLVFGSKHPLGVEKFLDLAWDNNKINGEANFDIDDDVQKEPTLFDKIPGFERPKTKREVFEANLEEFILRHGEITNRDVYFFTLNNGHPKSHAKECFNRLKREGKVDKGNIGFSYNSCVKKEPKIIRKI